MCDYDVYILYLYTCTYTYVCVYVCVCVCVCVKVMCEKPASWKKLSAISQSHQATAAANMAVIMERSYHLNDENQTEVEADAISKGPECVCVCVYVCSQCLV